MRINADLTLPERIDALWEAWVAAYPDGAGALDPHRAEPAACVHTSIRTHADAPGRTPDEKKGLKKGLKPKILSAGPRSNRRKPLLYNEKSRVGRPGLEPGTYGLKVRSSTIELATPGHEDKSEQNLPECGSPTLEEYLLAFSKWSEVELHL